MYFYSTLYYDQKLHKKRNKYWEWYFNIHCDPVAQCTTINRLAKLLRLWSSSYSIHFDMLKYHNIYYHINWNCFKVYEVESNAYFDYSNKEINKAKSIPWILQFNNVPLLMNVVYSIVKSKKRIHSTGISPMTWIHMMVFQTFNLIPRN